MTQKLEDLFDLANMEELDVEGEIEIEPSPDIDTAKLQLAELDSALDKIDAALPTVRDISTSDIELDRLSKLAEDGFTDLMQLGMDVEPMRGSEIFSTASSLLGHAIHAKNAKVNNKLKVVALQIQKAKLDLQKLKNSGETEAPIDGESTLLDRNAILAAILDKKK